MSLTGSPIADEIDFADFFSDIKPAISVSGLGHKFLGTAMLFSNLSFRFSAGDLIGICGPSGCGKSTLLSILAGWERPTQGAVNRIRIQNIGWVFQNPFGVPSRSALDHVVFPLLCKGISRGDAENQALDIMDKFGLAGIADQVFASLSGGEAQRLMLAKAVSIAPELLLVDEPTAQLDTSTAKTVNEVLSNIAMDGSIVVIATHDPDTRAACHNVIDLSVDGQGEK